MRAATALLTAGLLVGTLAACSDDDDKAKESVPQCVGKDTPDSTHIISAGPGPLPGGGRAVLHETHLDVTPPTALMYLLDGNPGEAFEATVSVGSTITVKAVKYSVVEICSGRVQLVKG
ncbi:hypothetical protein [Streptomyces sp. SID13031]|uniref:hypothetical protein n=1 Tax=Streptomyces sp. SID13031 TaxID=2706046 RepID=UPI0013CCD5A1|nr:hypothetical protein [Streptomyces sp. SID13031]NEA35892.1 hypothetical protein [Streptomyces sp. SID13031]